MTADTITTEELIEVAETVSPGDEVQLSTGDHDYQAPLNVVDSAVTEWLNPAENWRSARLVLEGSRGGQYTVEGVEGGKPARQYDDQYTKIITRLDPVDESETVSPQESTEPAEEDLDPVQALEAKRKAEGMTHYSNISHLTIDDVLDAVESAQTIFEIQDALRLNRQTVGWLLKEFGLRQSFKKNAVNGSPRSELIEIVRTNLDTDPPEGDDSWQEMYDRAEVS